MRLRHNKTLVASLFEREFFATDPAAFRGKWNTFFAKNQPLSMELGCGFGSFSRHFCRTNPDKNLLAVDISRDVLARFVREAYSLGEEMPENLRLSDMDLKKIDEYVTSEDGVRDIYIFFPNPWPKRSHNRRRLTHPFQLKKYHEILCQGGNIYFKTDDKGLYIDSLRYFSDCGFDITNHTDNLPADHGIEQISFVTEYEGKFRAKGQPIHAIIARKK